MAERIEERAPNGAKVQATAQAPVPPKPRKGLSAAAWFYSRGFNGSIR